jgi:hypothetical protein
MGMHTTASLNAASIVLLGTLLAPRAAQAQKISKTAEAGAYSVTLKVLPAESFSGPGAEMVWDSGAKPSLLNGPVHPNRHMVAFVKKDGSPVEDAAVAISYRRVSPKMGGWTRLPVARMHVAGQGLESTHYGNNVRLGPGSYEVRVTVDGSGPASFRFSLSH